jgi:hypothetical protein
MGRRPGPGLNPPGRECNPKPPVPTRTLAIQGGEEVSSSIAFEYEMKHVHHEVSVVVGNSAILGIGRIINVNRTLKIW